MGNPKYPEDYEVVWNGGELLPPRSTKPIRITLPRLFCKRSKRKGRDVVVLEPGQYLTLEGQKEENNE